MTAVSPVEILTNELYARFAVLIGTDEDTLTTELEGDLSEQTARRIGAALSTSPDLWVILNQDWRNR